MRVLEVRPLENCFDGSFQKELVLDGPVERDFILHLGELGQFQYFPNFPRPFFRIDDAERFSVQGIEGNTSVKVTLRRLDPNAALRVLIHSIESFRAAQS